MAQIQFKGKNFVQNHHLLVKYHELEPVKSKSIIDKVSLNDNLIIHGDNLKALKSLLPLYAGKIKCIYIDPPYNTGNENWIYNDNVNSPMMQDWLGKVVDREDLTRHDKWLCMMTPRLKLLREFLRGDGLICISIDDNEIHHLIMLMNEIFGEDNFRNLIIIRRGIKSVQAQFDTIDRLAIGAEYVLVYSKEHTYKLPTFHIELEEAKEGTWNNHWRGTDRPSMRYELFGITPKNGQWRWSKKRSLNAIRNYKICLKNLKRKETNFQQSEIDEWYAKQIEVGEEPDLLRLSTSGKPEHYVPPSDTRFGSSLWTDLKPNGSQQLKQIFGSKVFDNPKSIDLIKRLIIFSGATQNDIIFDSFAGSGTTAHAVLALNKEDGGTRKFILVECEDYADKITAERVRRIIKGVLTAKDEDLKKGLDGIFSFFELGKPIELESILDGKKLPSYNELARYVFYTATGEEFAEKFINRKRNFIGESKNYDVYLLYEQDMEILKSLALTLEKAEKLGPIKKDKRRLVFAPTKYLDQEFLDKYKIDFAQLPFEIYKLAD
jgi:adenine-specific DNA-methyltransferase